MMRKLLETEGIREDQQTQQPGKRLIHRAKPHHCLTDSSKDTKSIISYYSSRWSSYSTD